MKAILALGAAAALSGCAYYDPYVYGPAYGAPYGGAPYAVAPQPYYYGWGWGYGYGYRYGYRYGYPYGYPYSYPYGYRGIVAPFGYSRYGYGGYAYPGWYHTRPWIGARPHMRPRPVVQRPDAQAPRPAGAGSGHQSSRPPPK